MGSVPVQLRLLDEGAVRTLAGLYFAEFPKGESEEKTKMAEADDSGTLRGRIVQAIDAAVVGHMVAERRFCDSERGRRIIEAGMGILHGNTESLSSRLWESPDLLVSPPPVLRKRCLSLLRELVTSRFASQERVESFKSALHHAATKMTVPRYEEDEHVRELALGLIVKVLRQKKKGASIIHEIKGELDEVGERRIEEIQSMDAVEREVMGDTERDLWFRIGTELGRA